MSERVQEFAQDQLEVLFEDAGEHQLKNIGRPVRAYHVRFDRPATTRPALTVPSKPSIAVLPFQNLGDDPEQEYFADGMAEDIINELTKVPGLRVIARTSAFAFKGRAQDIRRIANVLGVSNILEGSFRNTGNQFRINAQLISAADGSHVWSGRFDRHLSDILTIQDEIAQSIAHALKAQLRGPGEQRPANAEAYELGSTSLRIT